jgi:probable O-glycosylation ligase (exosortase A-associated)
LVAFWALLTFTFVLVIAPHEFLPALAPFRLALVAGTVAIVAYLANRVFSGPGTVKASPEVWFAAALIGWATVTIPLSYDPALSLWFVRGVYLKTLVVFWLLGTVVNSVSRLRTFAWALTLASIPLAATAVHQYWAGQYLPQSTVGAPRIAGYEAPLTSDPNDLALTLNMWLPLTVGLLRIHRRVVVRGLLLSIIVLSLTGVVLTFSRGGFVTLVALSLAYVLALHGARRRRALVGLAALLLAMPLFSGAYVERLGTIFEMDRDVTGSAQERWSDSIAAIEYLVRNPLSGAGFRMGVEALNDQRGPTWKAVHNAYLEVAVDLGLPGAVLFVCLVRGCFRSARVVRNRSAEQPALRELGLLGEAISISIMAFAVGALFLPVAYRFYFYYSGGLAVAARAIYERKVVHAAAP